MGRGDMNRRDPFERLLVSLNDTVFDDSLWPATSRLLDEACGATGSSVIVGEGVGDEARVSFASFYRRGERRADLERDYYENYFHQDERVPRLRQLRDGKLVRVADLFSARELKTSATWNEALPRSGTQNALIARLHELRGLRVTWVIADPVSGDWDSDRIRTIRRLLPHIRNFVHVRQALADANAPGASLIHLLDNARIGVIHLDRRGRVVQVNDRARDLLKEDNGLRQQDGFLRAWLPGDDARLGRLVAAALPTLHAPAAGGSMQVRNPTVSPGLTLHIHPMTVRQKEFDGLPLGALVLIEGLDRPMLSDAGLVEATLGLTAVESRVAVLLAEGRTVPQIAAIIERAESSIRTHIKRIHRKLGISRRADLVRVVLSVADRGRLRLHP